MSENDKTDSETDIKPEYVDCSMELIDDRNPGQLKNIALDKQLKLEQRANIKFCFRLGKTFTQTFDMMKRVYGNKCMSRARVHEWFKRFKEGREDVNDDEHPGQKSFVITPQNIEIVREFITNKPNSSLRYMETQLNMSKNSIHRILTEKLGLIKVCDRFMPKSTNNIQQ